MAAWAERTPASLNRALDAFNAALRLDPDNAQALAGLSNTFILLREYTLLPDAQAYPLARDAARRALALNDDLPQAHAALAFAEFWGFWDAETAEREFEHAVALAGDWATGRHWYATFLAARGRFQEALIEIERALVHDPSSPAIQADRGLLLFHAGRPGEAIAELRRLAIAFPEFASPHRHLSVLHLIEGDDAGYLREARRMAELLEDHPQMVALEAAAAGLEANGRHGMLAALLADRTRRARSGAVSAYSVAWLSALAGDAAAALVWLQKSLDKREGEFVQVVFEPVLRGILNDDPVFQGLVARVAPIVRRRFASPRVLGAQLAAVLDRSPNAMMLLGPDGRLRYANIAAEGLLAEGGGFAVISGRLTCARPDEARRLSSLISQARAGESRVGSMAISSAQRLLPLSVNVAPMQDARDPSSNGSVLVAVADLEAAPPSPEARLRDLFGLTAAEGRLARSLFEGLTLAETAKIFGLSRHTVHAQLARIFEKTGVTRQSALMSLMMRLASAQLT